MSDPLERYLRDLREIPSSGMAVKETSYYPALSDLLNAVGQDLKPRVRCVINLKNSGAGIPDGGLFTPDQLRTADQGEPLMGHVPSRGVIEAKGTGDKVDQIAQSEQVRRYLRRYGQVLVTNYRDFLLVEPGGNDVAVLGERYALAGSEAAFWGGTLDPRSMAAEHGPRFVEYLRRVLLHNAPLAAPKDVAFFLASYARDAAARIERRGLPGLTTVRAALEEALGLRFEGQKGDHFFRSTLVQTLFYGLFSAWVLWSKDHPAEEEA